MSPEKRTITAEDLYNFQLLTGLEISPDGKWVIYARQRVDRKTEKKYSNLWIVSTEGGEPRQFTYGDQRDGRPRWSPDGRQIAFISNRGDEKQPQIYLIPAGGGEARPLTDLKGEIAAFEWSPDGRKLILQFRKKDAEALEREQDEQKKKLGIVARHYKRINYKLDGAGFLPQERWHIWTVDAESGEAAQLTDHEIYDETDPVWSPDGKWILFTSNRAPDPDIEYDSEEFYLIPAAGGEIRKLPAHGGSKMFPRFSPDGRWIAYYGTELRRTWWQNTSLYVVPFEPSQEEPAPARNLTAEFDFNVSSGVMTDLVGGAGELTPPTWSPGGERIYFPVGRHGSSRIHSVRRDGGDLQVHTPDKGAAGRFSLDRAGERMAYFFATMTDPGQIYRLDLSGGDSAPLTALNPWLRAVELGEVEEIWFHGRDGNPLQGWILTPPDFDPSRKYPAILEIHGGPMAQYGYFFMHEFYYLAAQGYVVFFSNPRGGQGYGEAHTKFIYGVWGDADYADLMSWTDLVLTRNFVDPERVGVTGGSYGGYMTLWVIGHTGRFKAAAAQRVVSNFISMWGTSDMNWRFTSLVGDPPPLEDLETAWNHSPLKYLPEATTPTLIIHSEEDHRCPIEQGEQAFVALKVLAKVDAEMVRFPGEPHGLSRVGRTDRRIVRLEHIRRWMDKYLH